MEKVKGVFLAKLAMVIAVIFTMLFSSFAPIISWAEEVLDASGNVTESDYVQYTQDWGSGRTELTINSGQTVNSTFNLQFDTLESFKDFKLTVTGLSKARASFSNTGEYYGTSSTTSTGGVQSFKEIPGGTRITGTIGFYFPSASDYKDYTENITVTLTGKYVKDGTTYNVKMVRKLAATVHTPEKVYTPYVYMHLTEDDSQVYTSSNTAALYSVSSIKKTYKLYIQYRHVREADIKFQFYRVGTNNNETYYPRYETGTNASGAYVIDSVKISGDASTITRNLDEEGKPYYTTNGGTWYTTNLEEGKVYVKVIYIDLDYTITDPEDELSTTIYAKMDAELNTFTTTINGTGSHNTETTATDTSSTYSTIGLYRYTPDSEPWGNSRIYVNYPNTYYNSSSLDNFIENGTMQSIFYTDFSYVAGEYSEADATITQANGSVGIYDATTRSIKTVTLNDNAMYVKSISVDIYNSSEDAWIKFYKTGETEPFYTATYQNRTYTAPEGVKIGSYYAVANNIHLYTYNGWNTTYELNVEGMNEQGITNDEILLIREISKKQTISGANMTETKGTATYTIKGSGRVILSNLSIIKDQTTDFSQNVSQIGINKTGKLTINLGNKNLTYEELQNVAVENTNPKVYIVLPSAYDINVKNVSIDTNKVNIDSYRIRKINSRTKVLEIICTGKTSRGENANITVDFDYVMKDEPTGGTASGNILYNGITAYMETDEKLYYVNHADSLDLNQNGNTSEEMAYSYQQYQITFNTQIQLSNGAYNAYGEVERNENVVVEEGKSVTYSVSLENNERTIKNINLVNRLPFIGNKSILESSQINLNSEFTLTNLRNIKVYKGYLTGGKSLIADTNYTIGYSSDAEAGLNSEYSTEETDAQTAKTFQVKFNDSYTLTSGYKIIVEFEMDVPENSEDGAKATQISAVKYNNGSSDVTQEAAGIKVEVGNTKGKIEVIKTFEGEDNTESVANIGIKITNLEDASISYEKQTDSNGKAIFENVEPGEYEVKETTDFEYYEAKSKYVRIVNGEEYIGDNAVQIVNIPKKVRVDIIKEWDDISEIPEDEIKFTLSGTSVAGTDVNEVITMSTSVNENGEDVQSGYAYVYMGDYIIEETTRKAGWITPIEEIVLRDNAEYTFTNEPNNGDIVINKTVPEGETVEGLSFKITGTGSVSYVNKDDEFVTFPVDRTVVIEEGNENVEISEDKRTAKITIKDIPVGIYQVEEINIPTMETELGTIAKYVDFVDVVAVPDTYNSETILDVENKHKTGDIEVEVKADEGVELDLFKVKVSGTSFYGNRFEQVYNVPTNGKVSVQGLEIGRYKVEELNTVEKDGKIVTTSPDGFEVTYTPEGVNSDGLLLNYEETKKVEINNKYSGTGIVKIIKTLEDEEDVSKAAGIQFEVRGKDLTQSDVKETITIGEDGTGTSGPIPVGTYGLYEVESTVDEKYEIVDEMEVIVTTSNTEEDPQVLNINNPLARGTIIMETEIAGGGYPSTPVTYSVTKVDDSLTAIGEPVTVVGNRTSHGELTDLKAGKYLVEQKTIPNGYIKDSPQVVTISRNESGYALFIIEKPTVEEFEKTRVIINKEIVNKEGNTATSEDFTNAKLDSNGNYSFEVKIQNTVTKQVYYAFVNNGSSKTIDGLPYGTYEVEEVYKPKFKMLEITGSRIGKNVDTGKYTFTLAEDENNINNKVTMTVKNQINTDFPFGGQDPMDNLSKVSVEAVETTFVRQSKIYVRDDEDNKVSDVTFNLYDKNNNVIKMSGSNGVYVEDENGEEGISPEDGAITLKSLPAGEYTLKCIEVSDSFLKSDDRTVKVYETAVGVTRIELLRNIPRGTLRLSTMYTDDYNVEHYTLNSKYKIIDPANFETLTFIKKLDGTYERSNLSNAKEEISLKAGTVDVTGIEAGVNYQIGIVDGPNSYGVIKETPEDVTVVADEVTNVKVNVKNRTFKFKKVVTSASGAVMALDEDGVLWYYSSSMSGSELVSMKGKAPKFKDVVADYTGTYLGVTEDGDVREWKINVYNSVPGFNETGRRFFSEGDPKIKQVSYQYYWEMTSRYALDENGKIWYWGTYNSQNSSDKWLPESTQAPVNLSELCDLNDVIITSLCETGSGQRHDCY